MTTPNTADEVKVEMKESNSTEAEVAVATTEMKTLFDEYREKIEKEIMKVEKGKITNVDPGTLMNWSIIAIRMVNTIKDLTGLQKKQLVIQIIHHILDNTIIGNPDIDQMIDKSAKLLLPAIIDGLVYMAKKNPLQKGSLLRKLICPCLPQ